MSMMDIWMNFFFKNGYEIMKHVMLVITYIIFLRFYGLTITILYFSLI